MGVWPPTPRLQSAALIQGESKEAHKERLKKLKQAYGNSLLLAGILSHNANFWVMRCILVVGQHFYLLQAALAKEKASPEGNLAFTTGLATGAGCRFLRRVWTKTVVDSRQLARLGIQAWLSCVCCARAVCVPVCVCCVSVCALSCAHRA